MKNPTLVIALLGLALIAAQVQTSAIGSQEDKQVEQEIRRLNSEEVNAFLHGDSQAMARLWSDDFVVTNPLNKFVTKKQVLGMVDSGFLVVTSHDRQIEYLRVYGDTVIVGRK